CILKGSSIAGELSDTRRALPPANGSGDAHATGPTQFPITGHRTPNVPQVRRVDVADSDWVGRIWLGTAHL
ncbi:MAG: hypothetical protein WCA25_03980, partial [Pseudolabrys sp.]